MIRFSDIEYRRPDLKKAAQELTEVLERFKAAETFEEADRLFLELDSSMSDVNTMCTVASIRNSVDLSDPFYAGEMKYINAEMAMLMPLNKMINHAILNTPFKDALKAKYGEQIFRLLDAGERVIAEENIPLSIEESELCDEYKLLTASCSCEFMGEKNNFYGLLKHMESTDRNERKAAFEEWARLYEDISDRLDGIYDKLIKNRVKQAENLGFGSFTEMAYLKRRRFDYKPGDTARFRGYVEKYVTPFINDMFEKQRKLLGIDKLHWYDEKLSFPEGNPTPHGSTQDMIDATLKMYEELSPETGEFFRFMSRYELFDLETKPNKRMGGYTTSLDSYKAPFIFSNFNGTAADVDVLTHEAGHAFEAYMAYRTQVLSDYTYSTSEINEIHSMTMEHFTYPWMDLFFGKDAGRRVFTHLLDALGSIPYLVSVDEFQHRVYEKPDMTHEERRACWKEIENRYMPWRDYDGNEFLMSGGFWMQKQHIFIYPFYYVDYALAQTCAFMLYKRMCEDSKKAWHDYLELCKRGGSLGYFETLRSADLGIPFDEKVFSDTIGFIKDKILELEKEC
ncbi:MAG: M3 family oligoendopeptidase [Christensenellaceae bacterium]|nr:M3 family oligoendopeptidase [Christensenellaceae bacterium]